MVTVLHELCAAAPAFCCRLCQPKWGDQEEDFSKLEKVQLKFDESGKEQWVPVKKVRQGMPEVAWPGAVGRQGGVEHP